MADKEAVLAKDVPKPPARPVFGPGSKLNWDNDANDPNKRKHVGLDPDGTKNVKNS